MGMNSESIKALESQETEGVISICKSMCKSLRMSKKYQLIQLLFMAQKCLSCKYNYLLQDLFKTY